MYQYLLMHINAFASAVIVWLPVWLWTDKGVHLELLDVLGLKCLQSPVTVQTSEVKNPQKTFEHEQYLFNGDTNGKQLLGAVMIMNDYDEDEG